MDSQGSGGDNGSAWQRWGEPATALLTQLAGLGIAANRGAVGPPLVALGDYLSRRGSIRRMTSLAEQFPEDSPEREQALVYAREGDLTPANLRTLRGDVANRRAELLLPDIVRGTPREAVIEPGAPPEAGELATLGRTTRPYTEGAPFEERARRVGALSGVDEATRAALMSLVRGMRAPEEGAVPSEVLAEQRAAAMRRGLEGEGVEPGRAKDAATEARFGGTPHVQIPPRLEASERTFSAEVQAGQHGDPKTAEGLVNIITAARARGLNHLADEYVKQRTFVKETREETTRARVRDTLVPQWRTQLGQLQARGALSDVSQTALEWAISTAEADPSPKNVTAAGTALKNVMQAEQQANLFQKKLEVNRGRIDAAMRSRNLGTAKHLLDSIGREIAQKTQIAQVHPDPVSRAHAAAQVEQLEAQRADLRDYLYSESFGMGGEENTGPDKRTHENPGGADDLRKKGYVQ